MTLFRAAYGRFKKKVWTHNRKKIMKHAAQRLRDKNITILSMNCAGRILYHDLGLRFLSPTINLYMQAEDFIRFCSRLPYYLSLDHLRPCVDPAILDGRTYPVAWLGDIKLFLVHYASVEQAEEKWNERKKRIQWERIVLLATDRDGMTDALKDRFEQLPYPKVMFVHLPDSRHPSCYYLKGYEKENAVGLITESTGWRGLRAIDQFDYTAFFNSVASKENNDS